MGAQINPARHFRRTHILLYTVVSTVYSKYITSDLCIENELLNHVTVSSAKPVKQPC